MAEFRGVPEELRDYHTFKKAIAPFPSNACRFLSNNTPFLMSSMSTIGVTNAEPYLDENDLE
jgi:hypothetical protein